MSGPKRRHIQNGMWQMLKRNRQKYLDIELTFIQMSCQSRQAARSRQGHQCRLSVHHQTESSDHTVLWSLQFVITLKFRLYSALRSLFCTIFTVNDHYCVNPGTTLTPIKEAWRKHSGDYFKPDGWTAQRLTEHTRMDSYKVKLLIL